MNHSIIITTKDVMKIFGCSYETARRKLRAAKDSLSTSKKKVSTVTISQFCSEFNIPEVEVRKAIAG